MDQDNGCPASASWHGARPVAPEEESCYYGHTISSIQGMKVSVSLPELDQALRVHLSL